jgi:phenylalanyl-tRNA synthetase beta chain
MVFSYNWLQSFFKKKLPSPQKLADLLTLHFAEVEEIKKAGKDFVLDIDVRPNRAGDCFSHLGIAREIAAIFNFKIQNPKSKIKDNKGLKTRDFIAVEVKDKNACPRYTAKVVTDVKVGSSPKWLRERLEICGLNSINNVVDIANYVMLETGQPLHAFDGEKLEGNKIVVRFAKNRERIVTLDEQKFDLNPDVLVIADERSPVAIAGIKGGKLPEIDRKTKVVVIESANFESRTIRRASQKLNLRTDASLRFEHGIDPNLTEEAVNRTAFLIQELANGKVARGLVDVYPKKILPKVIKLDLGYLESLLGIKIPEIKIKNILKSLDFKLIEVRPRSITLSVPTRRLDVTMPEDLIEEIGRIYGYDKIESAFPLSVLIPPKRNFNIFWEDIAKNVLKELGFTEVYNYAFLGEKEAKIFSYSERELIELENPLSSEQQYLRPSLIPNLLKNIEKNQRQLGEIRIFELGKIFRPTREEKRQLAGLIFRGDFYQLKGIVDFLLNSLGVSSIFYDEYKPTPEESKISFWHPKKCAEIKIDNKEIGFLGEISPKITDKLEVKDRVVLFDIDFDKLSQFVSEEQEFQPISRFPAAVRDIAVLVPRNIKVVEVLNKINAVGGSLIRDIDLFDIYEGAELPRGRKNLAFHIIYQAENKTLSAKEIDEIQNKIIKVLERNPSWQVRK